MELKENQLELYVLVEYGEPEMTEMQMRDGRWFQYLVYNYRGTEIVVKLPFVSWPRKWFIESSKSLGSDTNRLILEKRKVKGYE